MPFTFPEFAIRLADKRTASAADLRLYSAIEVEQYAYRVGDHLVPLTPLTEDDHLDAQERELARSEHVLWDEAEARPACAAPPPQTDHTPQQSSVKDQKDRGTCVPFASLAALEAIAQRDGQGTLDLSEQYANWLYMKNLGRNQCSDGMKTTLAAKFLSREGVCVESDYPYEDAATVATHCIAKPGASIRKRARYGIGSYALIERLGLLGPSIANTDYLECLLHKGHDIVFGTHVAWGKPDAHGVLDVLLDQYGNPLTSRGGHAMLMVGYNRSVPEPYFVLKNSWGSGHGHAGYLWLSYDYVREYAKYGYVVLTTRDDMPT